MGALVGFTGADGEDPTADDRELNGRANELGSCRQTTGRPSADRRTTGSRRAGRSHPTRESRRAGPRLAEGRGHVLLGDAVEMPARCSARSAMERRGGRGDVGDGWSAEGDGWPAEGDEADGDGGALGRRRGDGLHRQEDDEDRDDRARPAA